MTKVETASPWHDELEKVRGAVSGSNQPLFEPEVEAALEMMYHRLLKSAAGDAPEPDSILSNDLCDPRISPSRRTHQQYTLSPPGDSRPRTGVDGTPRLPSPPPSPQHKPYQSPFPDHRISPKRGTPSSRRSDASPEARLERNWNPFFASRRRQPPAAPPPPPPPPRAPKPKKAPRASSVGKKKKEASPVPRVPPVSPTREDEEALREQLVDFYDKHRHEIDRAEKKLEAELRNIDGQLKRRQQRTRSSPRVVSPHPARPRASSSSPQGDSSPRYTPHRYATSPPGRPADRSPAAVRTRSPRPTPSPAAPLPDVRKSVDDRLAHIRSHLGDTLPQKPVPNPPPTLRQSPLRPATTTPPSAPSEAASARSRTTTPPLTAQSARVPGGPPLSVTPLHLPHQHPVHVPSPLPSTIVPREAQPDALPSHTPDVVDSICQKLEQARLRGEPSRRPADGVDQDTLHHGETTLATSTGDDDHPMLADLVEHTPLQPTGTGPVTYHAVESPRRPRELREPVVTPSLLAVASPTPSRSASVQRETLAEQTAVSMPVHRPTVRPMSFPQSSYNARRKWEHVSYSDEATRRVLALRDEAKQVAQSTRSQLTSLSAQANRAVRSLSPSKKQPHPKQPTGAMDTASDIGDIDNEDEEEDVVAYPPPPKHRGDEKEDDEHLTTEGAIGVLNAIGSSLQKHNKSGDQLQAVIKRIDEVVDQRELEERTRPETREATVKEGSLRTLRREKGGELAWKDVWVEADDVELRFYPLNKHTKEAKPLGSVQYSNTAKINYDLGNDGIYYYFGLERHHKGKVSVFTLCAVSSGDRKGWCAFLDRQLRLTEQKRLGNLPSKWSEELPFEPVA